MTIERPTTAGLQAALDEGVQARVFPGAAAALGRLGGRRTGDAAAEQLLQAGVLAPGESGVTPDTPYDLASLTKPFVAAAALRLAQQRSIDLHAPVLNYLPEIEGTPGGETSLALLLSHRSGLAPWGSLFSEVSAPAGTPEAKRFILREAALRTDESVGSGRSVYSDLGYMIAGEALARAAGIGLDALLRREVTAPLEIASQVYYAASLDERAHELLQALVAPTELCSYRGRLLRGEVHDENCHALGGIAGHAGLFGTAQAVLRFGLAVLTALEGRSDWLDQALLRWALAPRGEGYVVGWDTKSAEDSSAGELFSESSFGHLGFTGTSIWCDPIRRLCAVLLTNRVHPTRDNNGIRAFRPRFHDLATGFGWVADGPR